MSKNYIILYVGEAGTIVFTSRVANSLDEAIEVFQRDHLDTNLKVKLKETLIHNMEELLCT